MKHKIKIQVLFLVFVVLLSDCKKQDDDPQGSSVPTTPDTEGNLAVFNKTDESLYLYHQGAVVKEIPANTDNFIINIPNENGLSKELKIWKVSTVNDVNNPPDNLLFRKWEVVLPSVATADERVSWVIQEEGGVASGTFSFNYPEFGNNNIPALYSVDVYLHNRTGSKITSVSPGTQGKKVGIEYGYHTVHYLYWYSDPNSTTGRENIGWIDTDADGNNIKYIVNTATPLREIQVPVYYDSPIGKTGELNITNLLDQVVLIYANGNLIESIAIEDTGSTTGLSYIEPNNSYVYRIPENCYHLEARDPSSNTVLETADNLCILTQYQGEWKIFISANYQSVNIINNLDERITFHDCFDEQYLGFWIEPLSTIQQNIRIDLNCIKGINWDNTWNVYLDSVVPVWIIDSVTNPPVSNSPILINPLDDSIINDLSPIFSWYNTSNALFYEIQVASDSVFNLQVFNKTGIFQSNYTHENNLSLGVYFWRVRASFEIGVSNWSETWSFEINNKK